MLKTWKKTSSARYGEQTIINNVIAILLNFLYNSIVILLLDRRHYAYFINK